MAASNQQDGDWVFVTKEEATSEQRKKGTETSYLLTRMSSEMQTPMNAIVGIADLLSQDSHLSTEQQEMVSVLQENASTLQTMYRNIRDYSVMKMGSGKHGTKTEFYFHHHIFNALKEAVCITSGRKLDLDLIYDFEGHIPSVVTGDYSYISQAIVKVVSTVMTSTKTRCYFKTTVSAASEESELFASTIDSPIVAKFAVTPYTTSSEDNAEVQSSMDSICKRLEQCSSEVNHLTEANLFIFKRRILAMGGEIWIEPSGDGGGQIKAISFTVPLYRKAGKAAQDFNSLQQIAYNNFVFHNTLVIDQGLTGLGDQVKKVFGELQTGWKIVQTDAECTDACEVKPPLLGWDCVIVETVEVVKKLKEQEQFTDVPFVVMSPFTLRISVTSAFEHGISMGMTVPTDPTEAARAVVFSKDARRNSTVPKLRLLMAEDNVVNQRISRKFLEEKYGHNLTIAANGAIAVELFKKEKFDIVFMDQAMPVMAGMEAAKKILEYEKQNNIRHTPLIMVTAHPNIRGYFNQLRHEYCDDVITKPLRPKSINDVIRRCARGLV